MRYENKNVFFEITNIDKNTIDFYKNGEKNYTDISWDFFIKEANEKLYKKIFKKDDTYDLYEYENKLLYENMSYNIDYLGYWYSEIQVLNNNVYINNNNRKVKDIYKNWKALCENLNTDEETQNPSQENNQSSANTTILNQNSKDKGSSPTINQNIIKKDPRVFWNGEIKETEIQKRISEVIKKYDLKLLTAVYKVVSSEKYTQKAKTNDLIKMIIDEFKKQYLELKK